MRVCALALSVPSLLLLASCAQQGASSQSHLVTGVEYGDLNRDEYTPVSRTAAASGAQAGTAARSTPTAKTGEPTPQASTNLPTLEAEQAAMTTREVANYKKYTTFTQLESSKGADQLPFMQGGYTQTPDGTASVGAAGVGTTLKAAHDAAIVAVQRAMMRSGSIPASRVVISQGAFRKLADGWQVFMQGQAGPGAVAKFQLYPAKAAEGQDEKLALPDLENPTR